MKFWISIAVLLAGLTGLSAALWFVGSSASAPTDCASKEPPDSADKVRPILVGSTIPKLTLTTVDGKPFDLNAAITKQPTVLLFYRGSWCVYCNAQMSELVTIEPDLLKLGYQMLAISPDLPEHLNESIKKHTLNYTVLSDPKMTAAKAFGVAFRVDDATYKMYQSYDIDLKKASGENHHLLPVPSVFILGKDGMIRFEYVNPNYKVRITPDLLLAAAKSALEK